MNLMQALDVIGTHINDARHYGDYDWETADKHLSRAAEILQWIRFHTRNIPDNPFDDITEE